MFGLNCFIENSLLGLLRDQPELLYVSCILPSLTVLYVPYILFSSSSRCSEPPEGSRVKARGRIARLEIMQS